MKISGQLKWTDYLASQRLHIRPAKWVRVLGYVLPGIFAIALLAYAFFTIVYGDETGTWAYLWPVFFLVGLFLLYYYAFLPWRVRRVFDQQKELSASFEHEITATGLVSSNPFGYVNRPWDHFRKWKENKDLLLLYLSDVQFVLIPKRFCTAEQTEAIHAHLGENKVPEAGSGYRGCFIAIAIYFVLLIIMGAILYLGIRRTLP